MSSVNKTSSLILGVALFLGLSTLGWFLSNAAIEYKEYERTVTVKGLAEQEFTADIVIWPIQFTLASNNLQGLYNDVDSNTCLLYQSDAADERTSVDLGGRRTLKQTNTK